MPLGRKGGGPSFRLGEGVHLHQGKGEGSEGEKEEDDTIGLSLRGRDALVRSFIGGGYLAIERRRGKKRS